MASGFQKFSIVSHIVLFITVGILITILLSIKGKADKRLEHASSYLRELGEQYITTTVHVEQTIPLKTEVTITRSIPVNIDMTVSDSILIQANIPVRDSIDVPINLNLNQNMIVDTNFKVNNRLKVLLFTEIPINQKFKMTMFGKNMPIEVPIEATIPLSQPVYIEFPELLQITSNLRVQLPVRDKMRVPITMTVPMNQKINLNLPIKQQAYVSFTTTMPIEGQIPIVMDIPVRIPLKDTPIKYYLDKVADELDDMLSIP
jgi:hypothetical protein